MAAPVPRPYRIGSTPAPGEALLAALRFGTAPGAGDDDATVAVPLPVLAGPHEECWLSPTPVQRGHAGALRYAENGTVLFGSLHVDAAALDADGVGPSVAAAYTQLAALLRARGYPRWLRLWNFLERITEGEGDDERYRHFNAGRAQALAAVPEVAAGLPAATAIGTPAGSGFTVLWLAGRALHGASVENPRQVPAFHYPRQYGPVPPSFARALRLGWTQGADLLVSGTASVVGHATRHSGDARAQFGETLANLDALLEEVARRHGERPATRWQARHLKLYVADPALLAELPLAALEERFAAGPASGRLLVLHGAVCRRDLLLEIEGVFECEGAADAEAARLDAADADAAGAGATAPLPAPPA